MAYHIDEWLSAAKCRGDADGWDADRIPPGSRKLYAFRQCFGCPVLLACAEGAIRDEAVGVIRAGIMLPANTKYAKRQLERVIEEGGPRPVTDRTAKVARAQKLWADAACACCGRKLRPPWGLGYEFPNTMASRSRSRCNGCAKHERNQPCPILEAAA